MTPPILAWLLALTCTLVLGTPIAHAEPATPGIHELTLEHHGQTLRYTVHLPASVGRRGQKHPVVLALHYAGHGTPHYATAYLEGLVQPGLQTLDAILVAPDCPGASWTADGVAPAVLALLDHAIATWRGDPEKVVLTGYSMGGMGTWALTAKHRDRFAAALPMAGHPRDTLASVQIPIYAIHGAHDELIPSGPTAAAVAQLQRGGTEAHLEIVPALTHYQVPAYAPSLVAAVPWIQRQLR